MKLIRSKGARSSVTLFSIATLSLAMTGILYAHWTSTLEVNGNVNTGSIGIAWTAVGTNDDGVEGLGDGDGPRCDDPDPLARPEWCGPFGDGTADPATFDSFGDGIPSDFYTKDVARCEAIADDQTLTVNAVNTYPSYMCSVWGNIGINGSVPVKVQAMTIQAFVVIDGIRTPVDVDPGTLAGEYIVPGLIDPQADFFVGIFGSEADVDLFGCGAQYEPDELLYLDGWFHMDQEAEQNANYVYEVDIDFVNYNEWDEAACDGLALSLDA